LGGAVFDYYNLKGLTDQGIEVHIPVVYTLECREQPGWKIYRIPLRRGYKMGLFLVNLLFFIWVLRIWRKTRFEILRVRSPEHLGYFSWLVRNLLKVKTVGIYLHLEPENRLQQWLHRKIAHSFSCVTATSQFTKRQLMERYRLPEKKIKVIYCGIPEDIFQTHKENGLFLKQYPLEGKKMLLYLGGLAERKNLLFLIDVFEQIKQKHPQTLLILCGGRFHPQDRYEMKLRGIVKDKGLQNSVFFVGKRSPSEKFALLQRADIFVFPSVLEGFGFAVSEAMAMGKPIVCSNRASLPELIEDGVSGFLADAQDVASFVEKVNRLLGDEPLCRRLGEKARAVARDRFVWSRTSAEYETLFREVLSQGRKK